MHCELCDFTCLKRGDWNRHILTKKHLKTQTGIRSLLVEQQKQLEKQQKQIQELTSKPFQVNVFLDTCKDAMNWEEFLLLELPLLERLKELGIYKRPIHCIQETLCIKQKNKWELNATPLLEHSTQDIRRKWEEKHPSWYTSEEETQEYISMLKEMEDIVTYVKV
jgi:hypothetical protein